MKYLIVALFVMSCGRSGEGKKEHASPEETPRSEMKHAGASAPVMKKATTMGPARRVPPSARSRALTLNESARLLAGLSVTSPAARSITGSKGWREYSDRIGKLWDKYVASRQRVVSTWSARYLRGVKLSSGALFYPFSGPDILHAEMFFPRTREVVMVGLEPPGSLFDLGGATASQTEEYIKRIEESIYHVTRISFFRTKSMKKQLFNKDVQALNGTLPTMLFFLARLGHEVMKVEPVTLTNEGGVTVGTQSSVAPLREVSMSTRGAKKGTVAGKKARSGKRRRRHLKYDIRGNRITFKRKDGSVVSLIYFSANLSDGAYRDRAGLPRTNLKSFLKKLKIAATYVKSASYLMHQGYFSYIRKLILKRSHWVLQDDSGIPVRFFITEWDNRFFGSYHKPIKIFSEYMQKDLSLIYGEKKQIRPLPFGIGYSIYASRSNLQLSRRMSAKEAAIHQEKLKKEAERKAREKARKGTSDSAPSGMGLAPSPMTLPAMKGTAPAIKGPAMKGGGSTPVKIPNGRGQ